MLSTALSVLAAVGLLMPGFVVAELSLARSARASRSDLELALRAVAYALVVHLLFAWWTVDVIEDMRPGSGLADRWIGVTAYVAIVLVGAPVVFGLGLNRFLAQAELRDGPPGLIAAGLGAGEARDAFDYVFQRKRGSGAWLIVELVGHTSDNPRLIGGIYGMSSAIGQTPCPHDIYLETLCTVEEDENGLRTLAQRLVPQRGVYLAATQIARIDVLLDGEGGSRDGLGTIGS